jgi:hypothetical protein
MSLRHNKWRNLFSSPLKAALDLYIQLKKLHISILTKGKKIKESAAVG